MNDAICLKCGYKDDINSFILDAMDEGDPNPTIECPQCGGCGESCNYTTTTTSTTPEPDELKNAISISIKT